MIIDSKNKSFCSFRLSKKAKVNYHQYCVRNNFLSLFPFIKQATFVIGLPEEFFIEKSYPFIPTYRHTFLVRFRSSMAPERHIAVLSQNTHTLIVCICAQSRDSLHLFLSGVFSLSCSLALFQFVRFPLAPSRLPFFSHTHKCAHRSCLIFLESMYRRSIMIDLNSFFLLFLFLILDQ